MRYATRSTVLAIIGILALAILGAGCSVDPMEELTQKKESPRVRDREEAILKLANLDDTRALKALVDVLESDDQMSDLAGVALVKKGRESGLTKKPNPVLDAVSQVMANVHLSDQFRARSAWVLGEIGNRQAIVALKIASADLKKPVIDAATAALDKLGYTSNAKALEIPPDALKGNVETLPKPAPIPITPPPPVA